MLLYSHLRTFEFVCLTARSDASVECTNFKTISLKFYGSEMALFCTLGMFIIDENRYPSSSERSNDYDIIGGAGLYALAGARIISGKERGRDVCAIVDKGSDFPPLVEQELLTWNAGITFREDKSRLTSRGVNIYDEDGVRHFEYLTPRKRIVAEDILADEFLLRAKSFHLICSIDRCNELIDGIKKKRNGNTLFIYEPLPDDCIIENLEKLMNLLPKIDVFTPNLHEALLFLGKDKLNLDMESIAQRFYQHMTKLNAGVVLRCGERGCYVMSDRVRDLFPAYHQDQNNVRDVTGGGNLFCGGFAAALALTYDWKISAICGNIVSGCIIELLGMPKVTQMAGDDEKWNGLSLKERLAVYAKENPVLSIKNKDVAELINKK